MFIVAKDDDESVCCLQQLNPSTPLLRVIVGNIFSEVSIYGKWSLSLIFLNFFIRSSPAFLFQFYYPNHSLLLLPLAQGGGGNSAPICGLVHHHKKYLHNRGPFYFYLKMFFFAFFFLFS